jgi:hypothetical protein
MRTILSVVLLLVLAVDASLANAQPQPGAEHKKLEAFAGEWTYEGEASESPFGPAGKFVGKQSGNLVLNGFFMLSEWEDTAIDSGFVAKGIILLGYDAKAKSYSDYSIEGDGSVLSGQIKLDGRTWTGSGTRTGADGKEYDVKFSLEFSADGKTCAESMEYSIDSGKTWSKFFELTMSKAKE